jgi:hypothetical protein
VLPNPGFEVAVAGAGIRGWQPLEPQGVTLELDAGTAHEGRASLRFSSSRQVASVQSNLFHTPASGRLALSVWIRTEELERQPVLRLALEGPSDVQSYYRFAQVGGQGAEAVPMKQEWTQYLFPIEDLPLEGLPQMRVRFDMMGPGTVWIDAIELYHLKFSKNERIELSKILATARGALREGEVTDCLKLLDGYWPQFLAEHVPAVDPTLRAARAKPTPLPPPDPPPEPGTLERLKDYVPKFMRF